MPKLSYPRIEKGHAITYLLDLYMNERSFVEELRRLREPYAKLLTRLAVAQAKFWFNCRQSLSAPKYKRTLHDFYYEYAIKRGKLPELPADLTKQQQQIEQRWQELQPYLDGLAELAYKWKLRAPWAVFVLVFYDIHGYLQAAGMPREADIPLDAFDDLFPWPPLLPALEIKVSSWCFMFYGREQIMTEIAKDIKAYEEKIKASGIKEYPSHLSSHAKWWFLHYIHNMPYDKIAQEEVYSLGGSLISYATNVGTAVRRFSRLIGIAPNSVK